MPAGHAVAAPVRSSQAKSSIVSGGPDDPNYVPAHAGLGDLFTRAQRWPELEDHLIRMAALGRTGSEAAEMLRGRSKLERGEFASARWALGRAAEQFPDSLPLRVLHSHAALREGMTREAEAALLSVLELAPDHAEARKNLAVLRAGRRLRPGEDITLTALFHAACASDDQFGPTLAALHNLVGDGAAVAMIEPTADALATVLAAKSGPVTAYATNKPPEFDLLEGLAGPRLKLKIGACSAITVDPVDWVVVGEMSGEPWTYAPLARQAFVRSGAAADELPINPDFAARPTRTPGFNVYDRHRTKGGAA